MAIKIASTQHCMAWLERELGRRAWSAARGSRRLAVSCRLLGLGHRGFKTSFPVLSSSETWHYLDLTLFFLAFYFHSPFRFYNIEAVNALFFWKYLNKTRSLLIVACLIFFLHKQVLVISL
jgi:hypothetical protein